MSKTVIGGTLSVEGQIEGSEELVIQGQLKGAIHDVREVLVDKTAEVDAEVHAVSVRIVGRLHGNVQAKERVEVATEGRMQGDIRAPRISIAEGAHYKGHIDTE